MFHLLKKFKKKTARNVKGTPQVLQHKIAISNNTLTVEMNPFQFTINKSITRGPRPYSDPHKIIGVAPNMPLITTIS